MPAWAVRGCWPGAGRGVQRALEEPAAPGFRGAVGGRALSSGATAGYRPRASPASEGSADRCAARVWSGAKRGASYQEASVGGKVASTAYDRGCCNGGVRGRFRTLGRESTSPVRIVRLKRPARTLPVWNKTSGAEEPEGVAHRRLHLVSDVPDVPGRLRARFNREAHEALEEAMRLCERADRLRADVSRIVAVSMAADGHTLGHREITDQAVAVEQLVDLVREAAGLLGQATWFWALTMNHEGPSDLSERFEWMPAAVNGERGRRW